VSSQVSRLDPALAPRWDRERRMQLAVDLLPQLDLESRNARTHRARDCGSTTAPATTGPASGPRPTSSTPATRKKPSRQNARSVRQVGACFVTPSS
jgi:hypothetical protein